MTDDNNKDQAIGEELITLLDDLLAKGKWDSSLFLKVSKKRLQTLRDEAKALLDDLQGAQHADGIGANAQQGPVLEAGECPVYIHLYLGGTATLPRWEQMLSTLGAYSVGRPIYTEEQHAIMAIRSKLNSENDSYAEVFIAKSAILDVPEDQQAHDKQGTPLLILKVGAISPDSISKFVLKGKTYRFLDGRLILRNDD